MADRPDQTFTVDQATDLARFFLGAQWFAWAMNSDCILGHPANGSQYVAGNWRDVFRLAGVKLPMRPRFTAHGPTVMNGSEVVASCRSVSMAERIANALNLYIPSRRGT